MFEPKTTVGKTQTQATGKAKTEYVGRGYYCTSKKGEKYLKLQITNGPTYLIFENKNKKEEKHPDVNAIIKDVTKK